MYISNCNMHKNLKNASTHITCLWVSMVNSLSLCTYKEIGILWLWNIYDWMTTRFPWKQLHITTGIGKCQQYCDVIYRELLFHFNNYFIFIITENYFLPWGFWEVTIFVCPIFPYCRCSFHWCIWTYFGFFLEKETLWQSGDLSRVYPFWDWLQPTRWPSTGQAV